MIKVLVVADERFHGTDLIDEVRSHIHGKSAEVEVLVIAPALAGSALEDELGSVDKGIVRAEKRLSSVIADLREVGIEAKGEVGDEDPVVAVGDGLREFAADEIVLVAHQSGERTYGEKDIWKRLEQDFRQPVVVLMVHHEEGSEGAGEVVEIDRSPVRARTEEEEIRATRNFPPLRPLDLAGIVIGIVGTILLGLIALEAAIDDDDGVTGAAAAILLIAIPAFLINAAHIVGILFFQSVRYEGIWEKFMAYLAIGWTVVGLIASLIIWQVWG